MIAGCISSIRRAFLAIAVAALPAVAIAEVTPENRTADMPDSWLVLYNLNSQDSIDWADWYQQERNIPDENMLGLSASLEEHLPDKATAQDQIIGPVRDLLDNDPAFEETIMGIILGYGLPGTYAQPYYGGPGGYSIPDALEDMYDDGLPPGPESAGGQQGYNDHDNPLWQGCMLPPEGRPTKAWMEEQRYMVARIDGPTLTDAMALTLRAKAIEDPRHSIYGEYVWYDYLDGALPGGKWQYLRYAVEEPELEEIPWTEFNADTDQTPHDAVRFGTHDIANWDNDRLYHPDAGSRILAFNYNSYGATTVRSTTAEGGRYVPNALAAGYAAAIGSTCEPGSCCYGPCPRIILAALREGWTLGESFHISGVFDDWVWTLVGDPFLTVPNWFDEEHTIQEAQALLCPGNGDLNEDGDVNGLDTQLFVGVLTGTIDNPKKIAAADLDGSGEVNDDDAYLFFAPVLYDTYDWDVLKGTGDANGDGVINGADVDAFVNMLLHGTDGLPLRKSWAADMNKDGGVTLEDISPFVEVLLLIPCDGSPHTPGGVGS